jgi:hypothetical protein
MHAIGALARNAAGERFTQYDDRRCSSRSSSCVRGATAVDARYVGLLSPRAPSGSGPASTVDGAATGGPCRSERVGGRRRPSFRRLAPFFFSCAHPEKEQTCMLLRGASRATVSALHLGHLLRHLRTRWSASQPRTSGNQRNTPLAPWPRARAESEAPISARSSG